MRIQIDCMQCKFVIDTPFRKDSPKINDILLEHIKEFNHKKYSIIIYES